MTESAADLKRQIIVALDQVFPEYGALFPDMFGETSRAFPRRCPAPEECESIGIRTLANLLDRASHGNLGREKAASHITKQGSPYLRRALYLAAMAQLKCRAPLYDYYLKKRGEGKAHREALIAVARKLVHVIYAVLSKQEPYDPAYSSASESNTL